MSIPEVFFINIDVVPFEELPVLILKGRFAMVIGLVLDVPDHGFRIAGAYSECPITRLPLKITIRLPFPLDPFR
jgi:hypothetical protein